MSEILLGCWDCNSCNTKGVPGDKYKCQKCGANRPDDVEFYLPDNAPIITNQEEITKANSGPDWKCYYCNSSVSALKSDCENCGSARPEFGERQAVTETITDKATGQKTTAQVGSNFKRLDDDNVSAATVPAPALRKPYFDTRKTYALALILSGLLSLAGIIWLCQSTDVPAEITGHSWQRIQHIEEYKTLSDGGWSYPNDAFDISQSPRIHHYNHVIDHYTTRTVTERVQTGSERYQSGTRTVNLGNGRFRRESVYSSRPIYSNRTRQVSEPVYRDDPVYATYYCYHINRWVNATPLVTSANNKNPIWPDISTIHSGVAVGCQRPSNREEKYIVSLKTIEDTSRNLEYNLPISQWLNLQLKQKIIATIRFGSVEKIKTLDVESSDTSNHSIY